MISFGKLLAAALEPGPWHALVALPDGGVALCGHGHADEATATACATKLEAVAVGRVDGTASSRSRSSTGS